MRAAVGKESGGAESGTRSVEELFQLKLLESVITCSCGGEGGDEPVDEENASSCSVEESLLVGRGGGGVESFPRESSSSLVADELPTAPESSSSLPPFGPFPDLVFSFARL